VMGCFTSKYLPYPTDMRQRSGFNMERGVNE
jgi:hypothetical protein